MGVADIGRPETPWLGPVAALLRQRLAAGWPNLGVCLGCQLIAHAAGADVGEIFTGFGIILRGAPAIGVAAAYGLALSVQPMAHDAPLEDVLSQAADLLERARPTAVNLAWAVDRCERVIAENSRLSAADLAARLVREAEGRAEGPARSALSEVEGLPTAPAECRLFYNHPKSSIQYPTSNIQHRPHTVRHSCRMH